jgi:hypothetical protein
VQRPTHASFFPFPFSTTRKRHVMGTPLIWCEHGCELCNPGNCRVHVVLRRFSQRNTLVSVCVTRSNALGKLDPKSWEPQPAVSGQFVARFPPATELYTLRTAPPLIHPMKTARTSCHQLFIPYFLSKSFVDQHCTSNPRAVGPMHADQTLLAHAGA